MRVSSEPNANLRVDLPGGDARDVVVSLVRESGTTGAVQQWDGTDDQPVAPLPTTTIDVGVSVRWARTTFSHAREPLRLRTHPALNVLFQITRNVAVHRIEATRLD